MRGNKLRSPKMRPASWDASLIYDSGRDDKRTGKPASREEGERGQFSRKENGRLPVVRKKPGPTTEGAEREKEESEGKCRTREDLKLKEKEKGFDWGLELFRK